MKMGHTPRHRVDTHQHLWVLSERAYDWIVPEYGILNADFRPEDVAGDIEKAGVTATVLVQAADTYDDTFYMLSVEREYPAIRGVVGWVPFNRPSEAREALDLLGKNPAIKGYRNLTHNYADPRWILQRPVLETLRDISARGLALDMVSINSEHSQAIAELAGTIPSLRIVVDHMAKPNIAAKEWDQWAEDMAELAQHDNVYVKHSGLNTASGEGWTARDWQPYVDYCLEKFGSQRMMMGSDWPVSLLAGDFVGVWEAQMDTISQLSPEEQDDLCFRTAQTFYGLELEA
jgi:L-fuconolactonase